MADYQISTSIDAKVSKFKNAFNQAKRIVERFKGSAESMKDTDVDADTSSFRAKMKAARRSMESFSSMKAKSTLDVNSSAASAQIDRFKAMLKSIPNKHRTRLEVDGKRATRAIRAVHNAIGNFKNSLDSLAGDIRTTGTIFSSMFRGVMLSSVTGLVPVIASLSTCLNGRTQCCSCSRRRSNRYGWRIRYSGRRCCRFRRNGYECIARWSRTAH